MIIEMAVIEIVVRWVVNACFKWATGAILYMFTVWLLGISGKIEKWGAVWIDEFVLLTAAGALVLAALALIGALVHTALHPNSFRD